MFRRLILHWVMLERERQTSLWGEQDHTIYEWTAIIAEELGDIASLINRGNTNDREYQDQLLHVAAVAVAALENLGLPSEPTCLGEMNWGDPAAARATRRRLLPYFSP